MKKILKITRNLVAILLTGAMIIPQFIHPVFAQELSLGIYPPIIQIQTEAPASIKAPLTIENSSNDPVELSIVLKPFTASPKNNGEVQFLPDGQLISGEDQHIFDKMQILDGDSVVNSVTLAPGQQKNLTLHVGLPKDEPPSDYYFTILFISKQQVIDQLTASATQGGVGINVLLSIGPKGKASGLLTNFSTPFWVDKGPIPFTTTVENTSDFFIVPKGDIVIKNMFGQIMGRLQFLPVNVISHSSRLLPDAKSGSLTQAIWPEIGLFGIYQATLTVSLSQEGPLFTKTIYFFAMPLPVLLGIILFCIVGTIIFLRVRDRLHHH